MSYFLNKVKFALFCLILLITPANFILFLIFVLLFAHFVV
jgi:hypothetical protein